MMVSVVTPVKRAEVEGMLSVLEKSKIKKTQIEGLRKKLLELKG